MLPTRVLVFDCGADHLSGGVFTSDREDSLRLDTHATELLNGSGEQGESWLSALSHALGVMLPRLTYQGRFCVITVPGHLALTKFVHTPAVARTKRDRIVQFEASQNIPYPLEEVAWDHTEVADDGGDVELVLSAVKRDVLEELCAVFENVGLSIVRIEPVNLAAVRGWRAGSIRVSGTSLLVDVGARTTQLMFVGRDDFFMRTLPFGGRLLTQTLAKKLSCDPEEAENIKCGLPGAGTENLDSSRGGLIDKAVAEFLTRLQAELTRSIYSYSSRTEATSPKEIILLGRGSWLPDLGRLISDSTALPVRRFEAGTDLSIHSLPERMMQDDSLLAMSGLARGHLHRAGVAMNLLPPERQEEQCARRARPWWLAGAALLLLALLPPIVYLQLTTSRLRARNEVMMSELDPLIKWDLLNRQNLERLETLRQRALILSGIAERRDRWAFFLGDLQRCLESVGDVWLDQMEVLPVSPLSSDSEKGATLRLKLSGKLLDSENPTAKAGADSYARVKQLLSSFSESKYVQTVSGERFDNSQPGILKFELTLIITPEEIL